MNIRGHHGRYRWRLGSGPMQSSSSRLVVPWTYIRVTEQVYISTPNVQLPDDPQRRSRVAHHWDLIWSASFMDLVF